MKRDWAVDEGMTYLNLIKPDFVVEIYVRVVFGVRPRPVEEPPEKHKQSAYGKMLCFPGLEAPFKLIWCAPKGLWTKHKHEKKIIHNDFATCLLR
jgi:hypothetical protein